MFIYPIIYILLLLSSLFDFSKQSKLVLYISVFLLILFIGFRGTCGADSLNYIIYYKNYTDSLFEWRNLEKQYAEYGFYYLSVILKTVWNNVDFYFLIIALLTLGIYLNTIKRLSIFPVLSLLVYYSRFMILREMNQIRGGLAISIVMFSLTFLINNNVRKYVIGILIASCFHISCMLALLYVWIYKIQISFKRACVLIIISGILGLFIGKIIRTALIEYGGVLALTYIDVSNLGLTNPVVLFQCVLSCIYVYYGSRISTYQKGYKVIRNAYLFSTVVLLLTSGLGVIGGRMSTIFATCEIFIIPDLIKIVKPRIYGYLLVLCCISGLFILNYKKLLDLSEIWRYSISFF